MLTGLSSKAGVVSRTLALAQGLGWTGTTVCHVECLSPHDSSGAGFPSKVVCLGPCLSAGLTVCPLEWTRGLLFEEQGQPTAGPGQACGECQWPLDTMSPWTFLLSPWSMPCGFPKGLWSLPSPPQESMQAYVTNVYNSAGECTDPEGHVHRREQEYFRCGGMASPDGQKGQVTLPPGRSLPVCMRADALGILGRPFRGSCTVLPRVQGGRINQRPQPEGAIPRVHLVQVCTMFQTQGTEQV